MYDERTYGAEHPNTLRAVFNIAMATKEAGGDAEEVAHLLLRCVEGFSRTQGLYCPMTTNVLYAMGEHLKESGLTEKFAPLAKACMIEVVRRDRPDLFKKLEGGPEE